MLRSKSYATLSPKSSSLGRIKKTQRIEFFLIFNFFSQRLCFCLHPKLRFFLFGPIIRKLWTILFSEQYKHFFGKTIYRTHFWMQFSKKFKFFFYYKVEFLWKNNPTTWIMVIQFHLRFINNLVFYSILNLLLLINF